MKRQLADKEEERERRRSKLGRFYRSSRKYHTISSFTSGIGRENGIGMPSTYRQAGHQRVQWQPQIERKEKDVAFFLSPWPFAGRTVVIKRWEEATQRGDAPSKTCPLSRDTKTGSKTTRRSVYSTVSSGHDPAVCAWRCKFACKRPNYSNVRGCKWFCVTVATTTGAFAESSADGIAATFEYPTAINWRRYRGQFPEYV
ncbi:hypothetical protein WN48_04111 [Eufriesea mexicana]|uniref:Uncharacterized protein n=1 Tax=Eufriesea mexicana TaxID=516756 RepID=A0A310SJN7_9HYME|nr:hypothetical protein WN48_04111 [Eufriesea mexicana]